MRMTRVPMVVVLGIAVVCLTRIPAAAQNESLPAENAAASARAPGPSRWHGGLGLLSAVPSGEFGTNIDHSWGLTGHLDARLGHSVFRLGIETSLVMYGSSERTVPLDQAIPEVPTALRVDTENDMWLLHARIRAERPRGRWRPYADGLVGFNDLVTRSTIPGGQDCYSMFFGGWCTESTIASHTNARDIVPSYGAGAGLMVGFSSSPRSPRLDIAVRYLSGGEGRYLTEGAIRNEGWASAPATSQSRTNMVTVFMGVSFGH
jgi:hypothetical protein